MNKKAILSLMLAILLPLTGYLVVKYYSKDAVQMPGHYYEPDSVVNVNSNGKTATDTIWHKVKNISLVNQMGKTVTLDSLHGKIIVIDFFFTRCASLCPRLAMSMKKLQDAYAQNDSIVQFLSISIDPEHDSVPQLRRFADRYNANHDSWWFLTGNKKEIYDFALHELKASIADTTVTPDFIHTDLLFLLDKQRVVRGFYHQQDTATKSKEDAASMQRLAQDISILMLEKGKNDPSIFRRFIPILPVIFAGIAIVFIVMGFLQWKRKKAATEENVS
jgi:protein SCO1/2